MALDVATVECLASKDDLPGGLSHTMAEMRRLAWQQHTEHTALVVAAACGHKGSQRVPGHAHNRGLMLPPDQLGSPPVVVALIEADADCLGAAACSTGCEVHSGACQTGQAEPLRAEGSMAAASNDAAAPVHPSVKASGALSSSTQASCEDGCTCEAGDCVRQRASL